MVHGTYPIRSGIRRLRRYDRRMLVEHFQRLDRDTLRLRFGGAVNDGFVTTYANRVLSPDAVVFGAFPDAALRGVAELRGLMDSWPRSAEVALSVEPDWQNAGIGEALFSRLIAAAQNRGVKTLHMLCLRENLPMRHLAAKHHARLTLQSGTIEATIAPPWPTPISMFEETFGDPGKYLRATFFLPGSLSE